MEWIVKVENQPKQRILVKYEPLNGLITAYGQYNTLGDWQKFSCNGISTAEMDLEKLQTLLADTLRDLKKNIESFEDLNKTFKLIGSINIEEPEDENKKSGGLMI